MNVPIKGLTSYGLERPSLPESSAFLARGVWDPEVHAHDLRELMLRDVRLLAALRWLRAGPERDALRSGTPQEVDGLLADLGIDPAREAALGVLLFRSLRVGRCERIDHDRHWTRALARGLAARYLSEHFDHGDAVRAFLSGLFADVGALILAESFPGRYGDLLDRDPDDQVHIATAERERFGIDRKGVAWALLRGLGFGKRVYQPMLAENRVLRGLDDEAGGGVPTTLEVHRIAGLLGDIICAEASERTHLWSELVRVRTERELDREVVNGLADRVVGDWWNWGDLLVVPTRTLPGFAELCDWNERGIEPVRYNTIRTGGLVAEEGDGRLRVLVVEDQRLVARATQARLERAGLHVQTAVDGEEALAKLRQDPPHVVLSDWQMPKMDGLELCRNIRRTELGQRTYFILFTGAESEQELVHAVQNGINDFVEKSTPQAVLVARIEAARTFLAHWETVDRDRRIIRTHCERSRTLAAQMQRNSLTDALTGLPNRRYAMERLREEWARSQRSGEPLSLLMMDIDHFKSVNDEHGHDVGDVVLQETAATLREHARRNETICRIGGEEFLVICSGATLGEAARCAERLRAAVGSNVVRVEGFERAVTLSLGAAQRTALVPDIDGLLKGADEAVYGAKEGGRDQVVVWPSMERVRFDQDERLAG